MKYINLQYERLPKNGNRVKYAIEGKDHTVEEAAAYYYMKNGYSVIFSENTYWNYLIALLFWDVIFAKIPEAVASYVKDEWIDEHSPEFKKAFRFVELNGMPSDFYTPKFYKNRKNMVENKLKHLNSTDLVDVISTSYKKYYGKACRLLYPKTLGKSVEYDWDKYSVYELSVVPTLIPKDVLLSILLRMIIDIADSRGAPDLICYNDKEIFFVEVKSENDKLSEYQVDWIEYLESLGLTVELCFINHSEKKIKNALKKFNKFRRTITISFGKSRSKNFGKVISHLEYEPTFEISKDDDGKEIYSISWDLCRDISKINELLDIVGTWKSLKIKVDDEEIGKKTIKSILTCIENKKDNYDARCYCKYDYEGEIPLGCRKVKGINPYEWRDFGYINTDNGDWIINKEEILSVVSEMEEGTKYCPYFDINKFKRQIEKIPDKINPAHDTGWAYIVKGWETWFKKDGKWWSWRRCENAPPEFVKVVGVKKLTSKEINKTIQDYKKYYNEDNDYNYVIEVESKITPRNKRHEKSGCFIATAVYQDYNAPEVVILRRFRDNYLINSMWGRLFVNVYYIVSPPIAKWLINHKLFSKIIRSVLDYMVKKLNDT